MEVIVALEHLQAAVQPESAAGERNPGRANIAGAYEPSCAAQVAAYVVRAVGVK